MSVNISEISQFEAASNSQTSLGQEAHLGLSRLVGPNGIYASEGVLFKEAYFGRDQLAMLKDIKEIRPELAPLVLTNLASTQGIRFDRVSEEHPGRIAHEVRLEKDLEPSVQIIFDDLTSRWGKRWSEKDQCWMMAYYGSTDATLDYIRELGDYKLNRDPGFFDTQVERIDGSITTMGESFDSALGWLLANLGASRSGLVEGKAVNRKGIPNPFWKDSNEFYVHDNGERVNHDLPISSIEVQGVAYDALMTAAELKPERREELIATAHRLRDRMIKLLWMPETDYFALGTDFGKDGLRPIRTLTSNPGSLLDTRIFDDLPEDEQAKYVGAIARTITGPDFLTDAGPRSRALSQANLVPFWDYHGSHVVWAKDASKIAKGLHRWKLDAAAKQIDNRVLNTIDAQRDPKTDKRNFGEFSYVDNEGKVLTHLLRSQTHGDFLVIESTNEPMEGQGWTYTAAIGTLALPQVAEHDFPTKKFWQIKLEKELLEQIPNIPRLEDNAGLITHYPVKPYMVKPSARSIAGNFLHEKLAAVANS